ncbi:HNH endonuclease [Candidatus Sulfidibacterium hydrothermale]|uniref:HNH endonuclease n=1 Tax=Candidatus Sulfidibacterium hydrothermale TaxID=2875962 RepID=UPI001F0B1996|nr:HNH endonuclease [Candidatus Sulfidibacterium hydrothermale]UBM61362.1 HNH endonuclease [Candidatus Sulfidibacterium hydrothermale]
MMKCIICRENKTEFNDEHVIPDSIQGYYHINTVCTDCNSRLGTLIDNKLTNHKFIEFQRHLLGIKGKSGKIPNPFSGTLFLKDNPEQKIRLELDSEGNFEPRLLPNIPKTFAETFTITLDIKDEHKKDEIINKFLKRNGIPKEQVRIEQVKEKENRPWIHASLKIDIKDFKLAILKIAYEFTIDQIPEYFNDSTAIKISKLLKEADFENLYKDITFFGDGLNNQILEPFSHLIEFENNNHYLILFESPNLGLICFVNLFNIFSLGIKMSDSSSFLPENLLVGKNDITKKSFEVYNIRELMSQTYTPIEYRFQYFLPKDQDIFNEFIKNDQDPNFDFYRENGKIPFFDKHGNIVYDDIDIKLKQNNLTKIPKGDTKNEIITQILLDEELYIKLLPINKLYRVISVQIEQYRKKKI